MFYSEQLEQKQVINFCARCETKFDKWHEYHAHVVDIRCALKIKPTRTTNRTKAQIVTDWELKNKGVLIG